MNWMTGADHRYPHDGTPAASSAGDERDFAEEPTIIHGRRWDSR
jgi:hypothetical protein